MAEKTTVNVSSTEASHVTIFLKSESEDEDGKLSNQVGPVLSVDNENQQKQKSSSFPLTDDEKHRKQGAPMSPQNVSLKKCVVIKHVTDKAILDKLKSGKMLVKKIVLPTPPTNNEPIKIVRPAVSIAGDVKQTLHTTNIKNPLPRLPVIKSVNTPLINNGQNKSKNTKILSEQKILNASCETPSVTLSKNSVSIYKLDIAEAKRHRKKSNYYGDDYVDPDDVSSQKDVNQKSYAKSSNLEKTIESSSDSSPSLKRKRGRPRKYPERKIIQLGNVSLSRDIESFHKRGRGRPRQSIDLNELCWNKDVTPDTNAQEDEMFKGFKSSEFSVINLEHKFLNMHTEELEDELPLSHISHTDDNFVNKLSVKKRLIIRQYKSANHLKQSINTNDLENCSDNSTKKLNLDSSKPIIILNSMNVKDIICAQFELDKFNLIFQTDCFDQQQLRQYFQMKNRYKNIFFASNKEISEYFAKS